MDSNVRPETMARITTKELDTLAKKFIETALNPLIKENI